MTQDSKIELFLTAIIEEEGIDQEDNSELSRANLKKAFQHLQNAIEDGQRTVGLEAFLTYYWGLLDVDYFIVQTHRIITGHNPEIGGIFSTNHRYSTYGKELYKYPHFLNPQYAQSSLQLLVDLHNQSLHRIRVDTAGEVERLERTIELASRFLFTLLSLHVFGDANGRLARILTGYILRSVHPNWLTIKSPDFVQELIELRDGEDPLTIASHEEAKSLTYRLFQIYPKNLIELLQRACNE